MSKIIAGEIRFNCGFRCIWSSVNNNHLLKKLHDTKQWSLLAIKTLEVNRNWDLNYFYLARAVEGLGYTETALIYYRLSSDSFFKCSHANVCMGFNLNEEISNSYNKNIDKLLLSQRNSSDTKNLNLADSTIISTPAVSDSQRQAIEERERQVELEAQRLAEERLKLDEDNSQRELAKQNSRITISATATQPDANGVVTINIQTNTDTSSLKINGEELGGKADGLYSVKKVARVGQDTKFTIAGIDVNGNTDTKTITVSRTIVESKVTYQQLNPDRIKRQPERDAVAVIIGISNYKSLPKAEFAKDDAQVFYDYAIRALGVKPGNIKLLMDEQADAEEIYTAFKTWLPARVKSTTDVYVFYSGHGLPTQDGSGLYWLPQRANRDLISKTGILLSEVNSDIQASKPKSVTIFMDACYSGQARGGETLVASARPIALKSQPTTFPANFTIISASQADQISSSSPDLQHGIFSYYLMRGMEGEVLTPKENGSFI